MNKAIPLKKQIALQLFQIYKRNAIKEHSLCYIFWESTLRCNLSCLHCGSDCKKEASVPDMPVKEFLRAIDSIRPIVNPHKTLIVFTGGESLLRKDIETCGRELHRREFPWGLVTNGYLLTKERLNSLLSSEMSSMTISLDGLEDTHNWLRGNPKSFHYAWQAIEMLTHVEDLKWDVVTCVHQRNFHQIKNLKEKLLQAGVKNWRIFTVFPVGRAKQYPELKLLPDQFKSLLEFIKETRIEKQIHLNYGCEGFLGSFEGDVRDEFFFCRAGIQVASILADGSITGCPNLRENFIQGNIYKDDFRKIWEEKYLPFRDRTWTKTGDCAQCKSFIYCQGNGMHLRNEMTNELLHCHLKEIMQAH